MSQSPTISVHNFPFNVVIFDPGGHTGYALARVKGIDRFYIEEYGYFFESDRVGELIDEADVIVSERIVLPGMNRAFNPVGIEVMGVITYLARKQKKEIHWQAPALMQTALKFGLVNPDEFSVEHPKDAVCHFGMFLVKQRLLSKVSGTLISVKNSLYLAQEESQ